MWAGITAVDEEEAETLTFTAEGVGSVGVPWRSLASDEDNRALTGSDAVAAAGAGAGTSVDALAGSTGDICDGD